MRLQLWDLAGDDELATHTSADLHGYHGFLVVYDEGERDSFACAPIAPSTRVRCASEGGGGGANGPTAPNSLHARRPLASLPHRHAKKLLAEAREYGPSDGCAVVVANKSDSYERRGSTISASEGRRIADKCGAGFVSTSAMSGDW